MSAVSQGQETWEELLRERVRALAEGLATGHQRSQVGGPSEGTAPSVDFLDARRFLDFALNRKEPSVPREARLHRLKRTVLRLARTFTRPQAEFNAAVVEVLERVLRELTALHGRLAAAQQGTRKARTRRDERLDGMLQELRATVQRTTQQAERLQALDAWRADQREMLVAMKKDQEALRQQLLQLRPAVVDDLATLMREHDELRQELVELRQDAANDAARERFETSIRDAHRQLREHVARMERKLRRLLAVSTEPETSASPPVPSAASRAVDVAFDYAGFEERFRGSEAEVKERQREYLPLFAGQQEVLDIGCGRGEFLDLLAEAGVGARGVEVDLDMMLHCREKGLDVVRADAFAYLAGLPDESLGGVFSAQVIEHLEASRVIELVSLCQRKLRAGGRLLLETPNPASLAVFARAFYMDFTHIRPIHPEAMRFLLESTGFRDVRLQFSSPVDAAERLVAFPDGSQDVQRFNRGLALLNELVYGPQDYAVIGTKGGPAL